MPHDAGTLLHNMLDSCQFVMEFSAGRTLDDLRNDRGFRSAVERELQIVGEALMVLTKVDPQTAAHISEFERIIRYRHVLVHGYDIVDPEITWAIVSEKVPVLARQVKHLLERKEASG